MASAIGHNTASATGYDTATATGQDTATATGHDIGKATCQDTSTAINHNTATANSHNTASAIGHDTATASGQDTATATGHTRGTDNLLYNSHHYTAIFFSSVFALGTGTQLQQIKLGFSRDRDIYYIYIWNLPKGNKTFRIETLFILLEKVWSNGLNP